jgi:uncharacterized membrane protein
MSNPTSPARHALWLALAALASFTGSATLIKWNGVVAGQAAGAPDSGVPALGLIVLVILLALGGLVLAAMAGKDLLDLRRQSQVR